MLASFDSPRMSAGRTNADVGLNAEEAAQRLTKAGPNEWHSASSVAVLLKVMQASEALFQTGWFVESLLTQSLVLFVIRTAHHPWQSRPHPYLLISVLSVAAVALVLPFAPFARTLGFVPLPIGFYAFVVVATGLYLGSVEVVKRWLLHSV